MSPLASGAQRSSGDLSSGRGRATCPSAESAALEGLLSDRKPRIALSAGTIDEEMAERLSRHCGEIHHLATQDPAAPPPQNVIVHVAEDPHPEWIRVLEELGGDGHTVDFVLLGLEPSPDGIRRDLEVLLDSPGTSNTVIVICNAMSGPVRGGLEQLEPEAWPKVAELDWNFVPGRMVRQEPALGELEGGLALIVTSAAAGALGKPASDSRHFDTFELLTGARSVAVATVHQQDRIAELSADIGDDQDGLADPWTERDRLRRQLRELEAAHGHLQAVWARTMASFSWRVTAPLRAFKSRLKGPDS